MGMTCKTCQRDDVREINGLLVNDVPLWKIVDNFKGVSLGAIQRHKENCIQSLFAEVRELKRQGLLADIDEVKNEIVATREDFIDNGNVRVQLIARRLDTIDKEAKLTGAYVQAATNPADITNSINAQVTRLVEKYGYDIEAAQALVNEVVRDEGFVQDVGKVG